MRSRPTSTTPDDRARDLRTAAAGFAAHLSSSPGAVLPPRHRLAVASLARGALLDYGGDGLGACPLGGMYGHVAGLGSRAGGTWDGPAGGAGECLATIVRSMVNFQGGLDARWYEDAVDAIRTSGVLSDYAEANRCADDGREMDLASRAAARSRCSRRSRTGYTRPSWPSGRRSRPSRRRGRWAGRRGR